MITREEYLEKMQKLRDELHYNADRNRQAFDQLEDNYRQKKTELFMEYESKRRELKEKKKSLQYEIELKMHELKVQWTQEHPVEEVKVIE